LITRVSTLKKQGFKFALDDFVYSSDWDPLIELADIIKFDLTMTTLKKIRPLSKNYPTKTFCSSLKKLRLMTTTKPTKALAAHCFKVFSLANPKQSKALH